MPRIIRVLIVDDSALIRQLLTRALSMDPRIEIVGTAKTGVEAIEQARALSPDVITLDIEMPELSGLEALPHIRKCTDARVVMLSSLDDPDTTYRALALGAVDFIPKPAAGMASSITELAELLLKTIRTAHRIDPSTAIAALQSHVAEDVGARGGDETFHPSDAPVAGAPLGACVAIASSTGGPPVLERAFAGILGSLPAAYVVVQHLPAGFSASLARRLNNAGEVRVGEAKDGDVLESGRGYVVPHGRHMIVRRDGERFVLVTSDDPPMHGVRPAADVTLMSVAEQFGERAIGVVLTGMGADGAEGALRIRKAGGDTVVQDEATSVVWGMPGAAVRAGAATRVVPAGLVAAEIRRAVRARCEAGGA
jgi:two-component system chemotaxis response regulator CheB